jgi:hypothetical protein
VNDDYFVVLPRSKLPPVKNSYRESVSLTKVRASPDFDLSNVTKYDSINQPIMPKYRPYADEHCCKTLEFVKLANKPVFHNTFDDLWDWRLSRGDVLFGEDMKASIKLYHHNDTLINRVADTGRKVPSGDRLDRMPTTNRGEELPSPTFPKMVKNYRTDYFTSEFVRNGSTLSDHSSEDEEQKAERHAARKEIQELAELATLDAETITKRYAKKLKRGKTDTASKVLDEVTPNSKNSVKNMDVKEPQLSMHNSIEDLGKVKSPTFDPNNFEISDDEEKAAKSRVLIKGLSLFKGFKGAKKIFKDFIRRMREKQKLRPQMFFADPKKDEDFKTIGDIEISFNQDQSNAAINVDPQGINLDISVQDPIAAVSNVEMENSAEPQNISTQRSGNQLMSTNRDRIIKRTDLNLVDKKPFAEIFNARSNIQSFDPKGNHNKITNGIEAPRSPPRNISEKEHNSSPNNKNTMKDSRAVSMSPVDKSKENSSDPQNIITSKSQLEVNSAIKLNQVQPLESGKTEKDTMKKVSNLKLPAKSSMKKNKKSRSSSNSEKKQRNYVDDRENLNEERSKELENEEKVENFYKSINYKHLKLEAGFTYNRIPAAGFSSVNDVVPHFAFDQRKRATEDALHLQENMKLQMKYTLATRLKKDKKKSKKAQGKNGVDASPTSPPAFEGRRRMRRSNSYVGDPRQDSDNASSSFLKVDFFPNISEAGSEFEFSEDSAPAFDYSKHSEEKIQKKLLIQTNDRYITQKPFPVNISLNKDEILASFDDPNDIIETGNKVAPTTLRKSSKSHDKTIDYLTDEAVVSDKFQKDFTDVDKDTKELKHEDCKYDFRMLYMTIRSKDTISKEIERFNWSGQDFVPASSFTLSQTEKSIFSLNTQKLDIWMLGYKGFVETCRRYCREFISSSIINTLLMVSVFLNTFMMALDGLTPDSWQDGFNTLNLAFTAIFAVEMLLKLFGFGPRNYLRDYFNVFDACVVVISLIEVIITYTSDSGGNKRSAASAFRAVRIFRIFRVLRVTRLLRSMRFMKVIMDVVKSTVEQFSYIAMLMFLFVFIFTLLGTQIFGGKFTFMEKTGTVRYNFDTFASAFYTAFIILTLENWNGILINCLRSDVHPAFSIIYLILWIFIGNYIFLNLFLAVLLEGFENSKSFQAMEELEVEGAELERVHKQLIEEMEEKKQKELEEEKEANRRVMVIVDPQAYAQEEQIKKHSACYVVVRNNEEDGDSLQEDLDLAKYFAQGESTKKKRINIYEGVYCSKTFFYFNKRNPIRIIFARIVSHPK